MPAETLESIAFRIACRGNLIHVQRNLLAVNTVLGNPPERQAGTLFP